MKVTVPEASDHLGISPDVVIPGCLLKALERRYRSYEVARGNNGSGSHDSRVYHGDRRPELHSGAIRR